jgi:thiol:disulfide interchange protein
MVADKGHTMLIGDFSQLSIQSNNLIDTRMKISRMTSFIVFTLLLVFIIWSGNANAQQKKSAKTEINFSTKEYWQVLALAKTAHKKIFVDAYATWCGPCKQLQNTTFKDAKVAAYYNKNFINFKIDVEKGEGINLAQKWKIEGLPTLLFIDEKGKIIADHVGYVDGKGLLEFAKEVSGK